MLKQIIIDGVDVAGCEFYKIEANEIYPKAQYCGSMRNTFCENEQNCYYKQLQRMRTENEAMRCELEELKDKHHNVLNLAKQNADSSEYCMRELEQQNEELKIQNESLRNHISDLLQQLNDTKEAQNAASSK